MPLPDHLRADFNIGWEGMVASFRLYWTLSSGSITLANVVQTADGIFQVFDGPLSNCLPADAVFQNVRIRYTTGGSEFEATSSDAGVVGQVESDSLPEHDCVCIRRKTSTTGRARRGRIFVPFVPELFSSDSGTIEPAGIAAYRLLATQMDDDITLAGTGQVLVNVQPSPSLNILIPITHCELVGQIVTRRDRQLEKGRRWILGVP